MKNIIATVIGYALLSAFLPAANAAPAGQINTGGQSLNFNCRDDENGTIPKCHCVGYMDCKALEKSGKCATDIGQCESTGDFDEQCFCVWARVNDERNKVNLPTAPTVLAPVPRKPSIKKPSLPIGQSIRQQNLPVDSKQKKAPTISDRIFRGNEIDLNDSLSEKKDIPADEDKTGRADRTLSPK